MNVKNFRLPNYKYLATITRLILFLMNNFIFIRVRMSLITQQYGD